MIIGIGSRARQGKDLTAERIVKFYDGETKTIRWADELYKQAENKDRKYPLVKMKKLGGIDVYYLLNHVRKLQDSTEADYEMFFAQEVPFLHKIMTERKLTEYWGMDKKDSEMLQFWGTDYRRKFHGDDYWVRKLADGLWNNIPDETLVIIPDTRFKNEYGFVKAVDGLFIRVIRLNADGTQFIAGDRDPNHKSETDLDDVEADYQVIAQSGDVAGLEESVRNFMKMFELKIKN